MVFYLFNKFSLGFRSYLLKKGAYAYLKWIYLQQMLLRVWSPNLLKKEKESFSSIPQSETHCNIRIEVSKLSLNTKVTRCR